MALALAPPPQAATLLFISFHFFALVNDG